MSGRMARLIEFKLPQVSGLQCITRPPEGALLITLVRVAGRGRPAPYNVVRPEERS